jgi:hypothetical protein
LYRRTSSCKNFATGGPAGVFRLQRPKTWMRNPKILQKKSSVFSAALMI